jgi:penicillin-binding protein 1A
MKQALYSAAHTVTGFLWRIWGGVRRHPLWFVAALPALAVLYVAAHIPFTPSIVDVRKAKAEQPTVVKTADGQELAVFKRANRDWVKLTDISPNVVAALIATEDRRFFEHGGLDLRRTVGAAVRSLGGDLQGGSTITQQLARNLYPEQVGRAATLTRKIKEAITALKIESVYDKNEILETYLNTVPFLYNAYGIEMAARTYFDKSADQLDVLESATLIGMLKGTSYYNPVLNPERAVQRRNIVLAQMVKSGKLEQSNFESLKGKPLGLDFERQAEPLGPAPHLAQQLRRWLIEWADRHGYNIHADGLVVHTTIDSRLQEMANQAVIRQADKLQAVASAQWKPAANKELVATLLRETQPYRAARDSGLADGEALKKLQSDSAFMHAFWEEKTRLQAGFLAMDPSNGHVKAWVGSRDFSQDQFDHVQQARRQPGSTFKPFVYGAAFEQGISPSEVLIDQAVEFRIDERTVWKPSDIHDATGLPTTLRDGLVQSKNTITAQLIQKVGPARVAKVAYDMGVRQSKLDQVPSLALGTSPVTLKEMVSAYGTIVNNGSFVEPMLVTRVTNLKGDVLQEFHPKAPEHGLSMAAAQTLLDVMRGVIEKGTGVGIRSRFGIQGDLAGKTGTTQDYTDGWFILMHPHLVSGAWMGFNDNRVTMRNDAWGQGAHNALNIVGDFFQQALKAKAVDKNARFAAPREQGMLDRMNDWLNSVFQNTPVPLEPQPAVVAEPPPEPAVVATPSQSPPEAMVLPAPSVVIREPSAPAAAEERRDAVELGAGPQAPPPELRPHRPGEVGVRILREVRPQEGSVQQ